MCVALQDYLFDEDQEEGVLSVDLLDGVYYLELYQVSLACVRYCVCVRA